MHASTSDTRSVDFSTDLGHSSSGSLRGIYSDTEYTDLDTHTTNTSPLGQSSTYDTRNDEKRMASVGSAESLFSSRKGNSSNAHKHRYASSKKKSKPKDSLSKKEESQQARSEPPMVDMSESGEGGEVSAAPTLVPEEEQKSNQCIVFLHNASELSLVLSQVVSDVEEDASSASAGPVSHQIPQAIQPGETKRFLFRGDVKFAFQTSTAMADASPPHVRMWTNVIDVEGEPRIEVNYSSQLPGGVKLIANRGEQISNFNPVLSIYILPQNASPTGLIDRAVLKDLIKTTYFDWWELDAMWLRWMSLTGGAAIDRTTFVHFFPELDDADVLSSIFHAFDKMAQEDASISFPEFVKGLSIMCRGDAYERAILAYDIFDLNNDGQVDRTEAIRLAQATSKVLNAHGLRKADYGDPEKAINSIYLKRAESLTFGHGGTPETARRKLIGRQDPYFLEEEEKEKEDESFRQRTRGTQPKMQFYHDDLPKAFFVQRALHEPDILDAFGLFDFFHWRFLQELESEHAREFGVTHFSPLRGQLRIIRSSIPNILKFWNRFGEMEIKNGFIVWKRGWSKRRLLKRPWTSAESLWDAKVKCVWNKKRQFQINLGNSRKRRIFEAETEEEAHKWIVTLRSHRRRPNRFRSFAPVRDHVYARWFVNAEDYFASLIQALDKAQTRVYIAAWAIAPELYLRRKSPLELSDRLDHVLKRTAERGVQVLILFYDAPRVLHLETDWVYNTLNRLHNNIIAIRHPSSWSDMIWSHHQKSIIVDETVAFIGGIDLTYWRFDNRKYDILDKEERIWPGKDYGNLYLHAEVNGPCTPGVIKRDEEPRMPWHDISLQVVGWVAVDASMNFIQRWNHTLKTGVSPRKCPPLMPLRSTQPVGRWPASKTDTEFVNPPPSNADFERIKLSTADLGFDHLVGQVVRSATRWSTGVAFPERSIYKAYIDIIEKAEHFIFIENQFFISSLEQASPKNRIVEALYLRICRAISNKEKFRVMVVVPVWPGGAITDGAIRFMTKYTYRSINRGGGHSLLEKLEAQFPHVDLSEYVYFFSLRQKGIVNNTLHTEAIYIHAKMMIVDDRHCIIGSANINDRSLLGTRDSEIALVLTATDKDSKMNGRPYKVSSFIQSLRIGVWQDFVGVSHSEAQVRFEDPVCNEVYRDIFLETAQKNTQLYIDLFGSMPDNTFKLEDFSRVRVDLTAPENRAKQELVDQISGVLVNFPLDFLKDESMAIGFFEKEKYVPRVTFL